MKAITEQLLEQLTSLEWFCALGVPTGDDVVQVFSWKDALALSRSKKANNAAIESMNVLTEKLAYEHLERYREWNTIGRELAKHTKPLVQTKTKDVIRTNKLPKVFFNWVHGDVMGACKELEYSDLVPPRFLHGACSLVSRRALAMQLGWQFSRRAARGFLNPADIWCDRQTV